MTVYAPTEDASTPLLSVLRQAGAVFSSRGGPPTAIHYGSAAGELAVCVRAVGLVDRSGLTKLEIEAPAAQLAYLLARLVGGAVCPGGALFAGNVWWCGAAPDRIVALCQPEAGERLYERVRAQALHHVAATIHDRSRDLAAIELVGASAGRVLQALGVYGPSNDPRAAAPFTAAPVGGIDALWLLQSDHRALALVPAGLAGDAWLAIEQAGRPQGISCVGLEAASRYALLERAGH